MVFQLQGQNTRRSPARGPRILMRQSQPRCHPVFGEREQAVALHVRRQPGGMCRMAVFQIFNMFLHLLDLHQSCYSLHVDFPMWRLARTMVSPNQRKLDHFSIETDGFGDPVFKKPPSGFSHFLLGVFVFLGHGKIHILWTNFELWGCPSA